MLPVELFRQFISEHALFDGTSKILLAVSGGKDSVLMAYLFNASGFNFGIAHCNFKLRGGESDLDEEFTRTLAAEFKVPFYSISFDTEVFSKQKRVSVEMAARTLRYTWFEEIRKNNHYDHIALAHHKNDSAETILLNLVRGTGISGMHGILPKRDKLVRPLLFLKREEINEIITNNNIPYREDSSNLSVKYLRNRIRLEVIPVLKELNPSLEETFEGNSRRFAEIEAYFVEQMNILRNRLLTEQPSGDYIIAVTDLKSLSPLRTLLFELFRPFNFSDSVLEDLTFAWDGNPGKIFESSTHMIVLDRNILILKTRNTGLKEEILVQKTEHTMYWGDHEFTSTGIAAKELELKKDLRYGYFDADLISFPLKFRSWKQGDCFYPFGMTGKKKLSDYFINKKVPLSSKHDIPVLENSNGDIIWIAGYQTDNRYKVTPQSEKVIIFEMIK